MKASELRQMSVDELSVKLLDLRKQQFTFSLKRSSGALEKFHVIGQARKTIARIKTILTEKQGEVKHG